MISPQSAEARLRTSYAKETRARIAEAKANLEMKDREIKLGAVNNLALAFEGVLDRSVPRIETSWVVDRLADLGIAAAKQGDLSTVRSVLGDFMKHAQAIEEVSPGDVEVLAGALAQLGPAAVANAARRLGLRLTREDEDGETVDLTEEQELRSREEIERQASEYQQAINRNYAWVRAEAELDEAHHTGGLAHTPSPTHAAIADGMNHKLTPMQAALAERLKLKEPR